MTLETPAVQNGTDLAPDKVQKLEALKKTLPLSRQLAWLQLAGVKQTTQELLERKGLELQALLLNYATLEALPLQEAIDNYKKGLKELPDIRKQFTRYLDKMSDELMDIQKNAEQFPTLKLAAERSLTLREEEEKKNSGALRIAEEVEAFKTHVKNEYINISTDYEQKLIKTRTDGYLKALDQELTEDGLKQFVAVTEAAMRAVERRQPTKFDYKLNAKETLQAIHKTIHAPDYAALLEIQLRQMYEKFNLYFQDRQAGEKAKTFIKEQSEKVTNSLQDRANTMQAVNTLVGKGSAATAVISTPGLKAVSRKSVIVINDNDPMFAKTVVAAFLARWDSCIQRCKVSKWGNLSVKQMAAALQEEEEMIPGLVYDEVKK